MANIFIEDPIYISDQELIDSTRDGYLKGDGREEERAILIVQAQLIIDSVIKEFGEKADPNQKYIFPTLNEGIPLNIKKAVVRLCENMYVAGELEGVTSGPVKGSIIKSEKYGDHQVVYQDEGVIGNVLSNKNKYITSDVELFLRPYINNVGVRFSKGI